MSTHHPLLTSLLLNKRKKQKSMEAKREAKEKEFGDENIHTVLFTAGTAVLMACLKRFIMMFFIEQWRLWVFLLLNVVLLAIFFTSMPSKTSTQSQECEEENVKMIKNKKKPQCGDAPESHHEHGNVKVKEEKKVEKCEEHVKQETTEDGKNEKEDDQDDEEEESPRLSKEELNERVEAFIATFRRHLVSDAIKGRDHYCFSKKKREINGSFVKLERRSVRRTSMNFSTQGANCFVL